MTNVEAINLFVALRVIQNGGQKYSWQFASAAARNLALLTDVVHAYEAARVVIVGTHGLHNDAGHLIVDNGEYNIVNAEGFNKDIAELNSSSADIEIKKVSEANMPAEMSIDHALALLPMVDANPCDYTQR